MCETGGSAPTFQQTMLSSRYRYLIDLLEILSISDFQFYDLSLQLNGFIFNHSQTVHIILSFYYW